jgi:hypothetical protein
VSDVAQANDGPPELPSDYREFRRAYRWPLLYGPWALGLVGVVMVGIGLFGDRPGEVALTAIGFGAAMVIASVLLPRMQGPLELGPGGVKGAVHGLPAAFMVAAVTAREVAEDMIPANEPDRDRKVDKAVERAARHWVNLHVVQTRDFPSIPSGVSPEVVAAWLASRQEENTRDTMKRILQEWMKNRPDKDDDS